MKPRGRRFTRRVGPRREMDWIPGIVGPLNDVSGSIVDAWTIIDPTDVAAKQDNCTVIRIVGEISVRMRGTDLHSALRVFMGIARVEFDNAGNVAVYDPSSLADADYDWMWRRAYDLDPVVHRVDGVAHIVGAVSSSFEQAHLDVKVNRKLNAMDGVVLYTRTASIGSTVLEEPIGIVCNLRSLVKLS